MTSYEPRWNKEKEVRYEFAIQVSVKMPATAGQREIVDALVKHAEEKIQVEFNNNRITPKYVLED